MIVIGIGANLPSASFGAPRKTCEASLVALAEREIKIIRKSPWYQSAPVPPSDQPDYVNGVAVLATSLSPHDLLAALHDVETRFGRRRTVANASRIIDLDLLAYDDVIVDGEHGLVVPHPRLAERAFVLYPLHDVAPDWRHPIVGESVDVLIGLLPAGQTCERLSG